MRKFVPVPLINDCKISDLTNLISSMTMPHPTTTLKLPSSNNQMLKKHNNKAHTIPILLPLPLILLPKYPVFSPPDTHPARYSQTAPYPRQTCGTTSRSLP